MASVTDTDASLAADGGELLAIPRVLVTGGSVTDGAGGPAQGLVLFDAGQVLVSPGEGGAAGVWENPAVAQVSAGVMTPLFLPDSHHAFVASFTYTITLKLEGFADFQVTGVAISKDSFPSGTCDLSQLV